MKMNLKIVLGVCIAFIITFGGLYLAVNFSDEAEKIDDKKDFFLSQSKLNENRILLLGSSHVGILNMTHIIKNISDKNPDITIYNLAVNGDSPKFRYGDLEEIVRLKPEIVFYGISYRDFNQPSESTNSQILNFDIKNYMEKMIPEEMKTINPQLLTRNVIKTFLDDTGIIKKPTYDIKPPNTPFFAIGELETKISDKNKLNKQLMIVLPAPSKIQIDYKDNEKLKKFEKIIKTLQEEEINVVIFTTPLNKLYLDELSESTEKSLKYILNDISEKYGITIYEFEERYSDLNIWNNVDHIAYNNKSLIFSDEIAEMVLQEIIS
jgi:RNase H-fold protein (predicted Holliday junction resolvase)